MSATESTPPVDRATRVRTAMERLDDCELAGVVATGLAVLVKREAWTPRAVQLRALRTVLGMLAALVARRQA